MTSENMIAASPRRLIFWCTREVRISSRLREGLIATWSLLFSKKFPPEVGGISFGDPESVPLEVSPWEDGFDFSQHVTEDQRELGQVPSADRRQEQKSGITETVSKFLWPSVAWKYWRPLAPPAAEGTTLWPCLLLKQNKEEGLFYCGLLFWSAFIWARTWTQHCCLMFTFSWKLLLTGCLKERDGELLV